MPAPTDRQAGFEDRGSLAALDVEPTQERLYRHLLRSGPASTEELAGLLGQPADHVRQLTEELSGLGMLIAARDRWVAAAPDVAVEQLIATRQQELTKARTAVASLMAERRSAHQDVDPDCPVEVLHGTDAVARAYAEVVANASHDLMVLSTSPFVADDGDTSAEVLATLRRGVVCQSVYDRSALDVPDSLADITRFQQAGEQIRVTDELPMKLLVADRAAALLPACDDNRDEWLRVRGGSLVDGLRWMFELVWRRSVPLSSPEPGAAAADIALSPEDVRLLGLLFGGLADAAIARQFGTSLRTVQRRITRLMALAGVASRAQLAWQAAREGWLAG